MSEFTEQHDLESFAKFIGLVGEDYDLFYETYYSIENESYEEELTQVELDLIESYHVS